MFTIHYAPTAEGKTLCGKVTYGESDHAWVYGEAKGFDCLECINLYDEQSATEKKVVIHFGNTNSDILCGTLHDEYNALSTDINNVDCPECIDKYNAGVPGAMQKSIPIKNYEGSDHLVIHALGGKVVGSSVFCGAQNFEDGVDVILANRDPRHVTCAVCLKIRRDQMEADGPKMHGIDKFPIHVPVGQGLIVPDPQYIMSNKQLQKAIDRAKWRHPFGQMPAGMQEHLEEHLEGLLEIQLQRAKEMKK